MYLHFDGSEILSAVINIEPFNLTISDGSGNIINGSIDGGSITIGDIVIMSAGVDTGDVNESVYITYP